jgi:hypothetical protein
MTRSELLVGNPARNMNSNDAPIEGNGASIHGKFAPIEGKFMPVDGTSASIEPFALDSSQGSSIRMRLRPGRLF